MLRRLLFPWLTDRINNTYAYGTSGYCPSAYNLATSGCTTFRGGAYNILTSTTQGHADVTTYPIDTSPWNNLSMYADTLELTSNISLTSFPVGVPISDLGQQAYQPMNGFGIGPNSTLLRALRSAGQIASHSWSMFWGIDGNVEQMDGIFVLGGYDKAKVQGTGYTEEVVYSSTCATGMVLSITDLTLNFANGTDSSIFPASASTALQVCLEPDYPALMTIPLDPYFQNFETLTNVTLSSRSLGIIYFANRYSPGDDRYTGDLTIKFQSGLSVRIPNDQLVVPDRYVASNGTIYHTENYTTTLLAIQDVNANDMSILGRPFLSAAQLFFNGDTNLYTLWEANTTTDIDLVAIDDTNRVVSTDCSEASGTDAATTTASYLSPSDGSSTGSSASASASASSKLSSGSIAGIAVGSIAGVALIVGAVLFFLRRGRKKPMTPRPELADNVYNPYQEGMYRDGMVTKENMMANGYLPEMPAGSVMAAPTRPYITTRPTQQEHFELMG